MKNKYLSDDGAKLQRRIRSVIWKIGGILVGITFVVGLSILLKGILPILGVFVLGGIIPVEVILTYFATQCVSVETEYVIKEDISDVKNNLRIVKSNDNSIQRQVEFTEIQPIRHLEIVNSNNYTYKRKK